MRICASLVLIIVTSAGFGCTHAGGKLMVDSPAVVYQAPDIDEITGIDSSDTEDAGSGSGSGSGSASAQNPHK